MAADYQEALKKTGLSLRSHQISGIEQILAWRNSNHGGIVADDMGLGKTCMAVAVISILDTLDKQTRSLIICPLSVIDHWEVELKRFGMGKLNVVKYTGAIEVREKLRKEMRNQTEWNVLLTTYQYVIKDAEHINRWRYTALFFDEAHRLKSSSSMLHEIIRELNVDWVLLLTGTPIQNNINELYSLLTLVDKKRFLLSKADDFAKKFRNTDSEEVAEELRDLLAAYLLRRTKEEVAIEIPSSTQVILYHGISDTQKKLYRAILCKNYRFFEQMDSKNGDQPSGSKTSLLNIMMQLRKCVAHPYLFEGIEPEPFEEGEHLVEASGKLAVLDRLLNLLRTRTHRVLIFSQMTRVLDIVQDFLTYRGYSYERLDGSVRAEERFAAISSFQKADAKTFCFLLSTRAGGVGLTLTGADTVVFLDSDFNPQNDLQAAARCHRIGQTKPVKVIRLIARHTVEEVIQYRAIRKLRMTRQVLGSSESEKENLTAAEISNMILYGLGHLDEEGSDDKQRKMLTDEELENIIGKTERGNWKVEESEKEIEEPIESAGKENIGTEETEKVEEGIRDMYIFEGRDYKKDRESLNDIITEGRAAEDTPRTSQAPGHLNQSPTRTRKPLTKEQIEERSRKRAETLRKKKEMEAEERVRKETARHERKKNLWKKYDYVSPTLPLPLSEDEEEVQDLEDNEEDGEDYGPFFVVGDVTKPTRRSGDKTNHAVIVHVVDNSGKFGRGGVFNALRSKSTSVDKTYELAGRMDDLHVGDALLIDGVSETSSASVAEEVKEVLVEGDESFGDQPSTSAVGESRKRKESVVLLVAQHTQHRDEISQEALGKCLRRLSDYAATNGDISIHMPRIGYGMQNIQWYIIERLIRKYLTTKRIPAYIYYYRRGGTAHQVAEQPQRPMKRKRTPNAPAASPGKPRASKSPPKSRRKDPGLRSRKGEDEDEDDDFVVHDDSDVDEMSSGDEEEEEVEMADNESTSEEEEDVDYDGSSSSDTKPTRPKRPVKRSRVEPTSIFQNLKFCLQGLSAEDRRRYTDIIIAQDGTVIDHTTTESDADYVIVEGSMSASDLKKLKEKCSPNRGFVKKEWIDECFDASRLIDPAGFVP